MRTVALARLLCSMQPGTALMGLCFTPNALHAAVTSDNLLEPIKLPAAGSLDPDGLLKVVKERQVVLKSSTFSLVHFPGLTPLNLHK